MRRLLPVVNADSTYVERVGVNIGPETSARTPGPQPDRQQMNASKLLCLATSQLKALMTKRAYKATP
ncbi:hypothetical protein P3T23_007849 [Paraburkholderia sp. GAS448]